MWSKSRGFCSQSTWGQRDDCTGGEQKSKPEETVFSFFGGLQTFPPRHLSLKFRRPQFLLSVEPNYHCSWVRRAIPFGKSSEVACPSPVPASCVGLRSDTLDCFPLSRSGPSPSSHFSRLKSLFSTSNTRKPAQSWNNHTVFPCGVATTASSRPSSSWQRQRD